MTAATCLFWDSLDLIPRYLADLTFSRNGVCILKFDGIFFVCNREDLAFAGVEFH